MSVSAVHILLSMHRLLCWGFSFCRSLVLIDFSPNLQNFPSACEETLVDMYRYITLTLIKNVKCHISICEILILQNLACKTDSVPKGKFLYKSTIYVMTIWPFSCPKEPLRQDSDYWKKTMVVIIEIFVSCTVNVKLALHSKYMKIPQTNEKIETKI